MGEWDDQWWLLEEIFRWLTVSWEYVLTLLQRPESETLGKSLSPIRFHFLTRKMRIMASAAPGSEKLGG